MTKKPDRYLSAIDVGTSKVCALISEPTPEGTLRVIGVGTAPSHGMRKGVVVDIEEASTAIATAVDKASRMAGCDLSVASVGIAGGHIAAVNSRGVVAVARADHYVTQDDITRAVEAARAVAIPNNREILHVIPRSFVIDGQGGVRNPVGMLGFRLEVEAHIVTGSTTSIQNLVRCVERAGVQVGDMVLQPLASSQTALSSEEKEMGVVLADIGGGTTDIAIFMEGSIWHSVVLPVGGNHLTNDIAVGLRTSAAAAEEAKISYGHAIAAAVDPTETVELATFGSRDRQIIERRRLAQIIQARVEEIFGLILNEVKRSGYEGLLPAGVVLSGGTAALHGISDLGREYMQLPVRVGYPRGVSGLVDTISGPAYATSIGLLLWSQAQGITNTVAPPPTRGRSIVAKVGEWLRGFLT
jgi:cell division protein FtsA